MKKFSVPSYSQVLLEEYAVLKKPTADILYDFSFILEYQLSRFKDYLGDITLKKINNKLEVSKKLRTAPQSRNRLYLITDVDIPELILIDVENCVLDHIKEFCDIIDIPLPDEIPVEYCNTLFIFSNEGLYISDIYTKTFAELMRCFQSQNALSNARIRNSWYNSPKRKYGHQD